MFIYDLRFCHLSTHFFDKTFKDYYAEQGRNHGKNLGATSAMVGRICPPGCNRVKVSQNVGATAVAPVASVDTSLQ